MATAEPEVPVTEQLPAAEETKPVEKPPVKDKRPRSSRVKKPAVPKEKKPAAPKEKKPKQPKAAAHPPYFQMIMEALLALNEKGGSSPYAIAKYMEEKHKAKPAKKVVAKKKTTPAKPKQPKSIKSPAAKKAKKATA
ncbi:Histone H1/H5 [Corchorus olitorius]|uniref:Histone H1/H5 n=1 Tax=Corchorus olitorius TaxID=93759 RepID=A0A1R3IQ69_9ROSI|nr:Histone H1/H5 [Corchorus olitorius]